MTNTSNQISKSAMLFGTIGLVGGIFYSFKKGDNMQKVLITGGVVGLCGFLLGSALNKLYE